MKTIKNSSHSKTDDVLDELLSEVSELERNRIDTRMRIAANIDDLLKSKNWKKQALAEKLNKQPSEISKWLSGTHNFTSDTLADIAFVLDVQIDELVSNNISDVVYDFHCQTSANTYGVIDVKHFSETISKLSKVRDILKKDLHTFKGSDMHTFVASSMPHIYLGSGSVAQSSGRGQDSFMEKYIYYKEHVK